MMAWFWKVVAGLMAGASAFLYAFLRWTQIQRDNAREKAEREKRRADTAEARIDQRQKADQANQEAKEEGEQSVEEAVDRARAGHRDHFQSGMRDDD